MRRNFNSVQMLETSDVCNKYSKSVSYETLVGGTTTTGREIKQKKSSLILRKAKFQAIFKFVLPLASKASSYKQPQNVVYNADGEVFLSRRRTTVKRGEIRKRVPEDKSCKLLSRLEGIKYNRISAFVSIPVLLIRRSLEFFRVPRKNRDDSSFCFGFAKILALLFTLFATAESRAASDCAEGEQNCWDCGKTENDLCTARLNTTTKALSVTGSGEMRDYQGMWDDTTKTPWGVDYISLSVQGVKNIGRQAFENTKLTSVSIGDTVTKIGPGAFDHNLFLPSITIPDSVTSIDAVAFFNNNSLSKVFIPESVTEVVTFLHSFAGDTNEKGPFDKNYGGSTIYCAETTPCYSYIDSNIITYTKDSNGVYKIGDKYYASPDDMLANSACGSGSSASDECITAALAYQDQKAENMAGGALCATKEDCLKLIDRANKKDVCNSIADCANNYDKNCFKQGNVVYNNECVAEYPFAKKRWTPAEANEWLHDGNDNFVVITFKK